MNFKTFENIKSLEKMSVTTKAFDSFLKKNSNQIVAININDKFKKFARETNVFNTNNTYSDNLLDNCKIAVFNNEFKHLTYCNYLVGNDRRLVEILFTII